MTATSTILHTAIVGMETWFEGVEDSVALERSIYRGVPVASAVGPAPELRPLCEKLVARAIADAGLAPGARIALLGAEAASSATLLPDLRAVSGAISGDAIGSGSMALIRGLRRSDELLEARQVDAVVILSVDLSWSESRRSGGCAFVVARRESRSQSRRLYAFLDSLAFVEGMSGPSPAADDVRWAAELALGEAGIDGQEVGYVELSGAANVVAAATEFDGLAAALRATTPTCAIGSVSATLGSTTAAAGLLQACFCLQRRYLPAAVGVAKVDLPIDTPFFAPDESRPFFAPPGNRRALLHAVDGQTTACVVLREDAGATPSLPRYDPVSPLTLLPVVAQNPGALLNALEALETRLTSGASLKALAAELIALSAGEPGAPLGVALIAGDADALRAELRAARLGIPKAFSNGTDWQTPVGSTFSPRPQGKEGKLAFVYPGAFSGYVGLGRDAFRLFPWLFESGSGLPTDLASTFAEGLLYPRWRRAVTPELRMKAEGRFLDDHIAAFSVSAASAVLYTRVARDVFGLRPQMAFGYSLGEGSMFPALGAWNDPDLQRTQLHSSALFRTRLGGPREALRSFWEARGVPVPPGPAPWATYVLRTSAEHVRTAIKHAQNVFLTIVNTPDEVVIGGLPADCAQFVADLRCDHLLVPYAQLLHSEVVATEEDEIARLHSYPTREVRRTAFYSATSEKPLVLERESLARTIARMSREPLDFPRLVDRLWQDGARIFLELGAGSSCSRLIAANLQGRPNLTVSIDRRGVDVQTALVRCLARLFTHRVQVDLSPLVSSGVAA